MADKLPPFVREKYTGHTPAPWLGITLPAGDTFQIQTEQGWKIATLQDKRLVKDAPLVLAELGHQKEECDSLGHQNFRLRAERDTLRGIVNLTQTVLGKQQEYFAHRSPVTLRLCKSLEEELQGRIRDWQKTYSAPAGGQTAEPNLFSRVEKTINNGSRLSRNQKGADDV